MQNNKKIWKVKTSKIHGSGVFASQNIKKGTRISYAERFKEIEQEKKRGK